MANKRTSLRGKKRARSGSARSQTRAEQLAEARSISLEEWVARVKGLDSSGADGELREGVAPPRGACLVKDPRTGQSLCIRTTPEACKALKGSFLGGPCG
jgi:hypothetical protein